MEDLRPDCRMKRMLWVVVICLLISLAVANAGQFITIRVVIQNHQNQLIQVQQAINQRDQQVNRMIGQLRASKTIEEVKEVLATIQ